MTTAKRFYKLWNKSFYDTHPPLYAWLIKKLRYLEYWRAGIIVSFFCSLALFFVCGKLYDVLGLNPNQKLIAQLALTLNYTLIYYSNRVFRYQLIALLGTSTIYLLLTKQFFAGGLTWGLLGLTCSYVALRGFWIWACLGFNWITLTTFLVVYGSWIYDKMNIYLFHEYYPSGIDGKIERVKDFTLKQLISPLYFNWTYAYYGKKELGYDFKNWPKKIGGVFGLYQTKNKYLNIVLGLITCVFIFFTINGAMVSPAWVWILTLILLYPSLLKRFLPRNSIIAIPLLAYLMAKGTPYIPETWLYFELLVASVAFLWLNRTFALTEPKIKARLTSHYIDNLPKNGGVMVEGIIAYPIAYRSNRRIVVLPHDPIKLKAIEQIKLSFKHFDIRYIVLSDLWKTEEHLGYPAVKYIQHTKYFNGLEYVNRFRLIKTIHEDGDNYYVYELS